MVWCLDLSGLLTQTCKFCNRPQRVGVQSIYIVTHIDSLVEQRNLEKLRSAFVGKSVFIKSRCGRWQ